MKESIESSNIIFEPIPWTEVSDPAVLKNIPLVSVLINTYNHAPYIAQAIEGVLHQETSFPIELVIWEDCSTDHTMEIVLNFQHKYPNVIRVITSEKNVGSFNNLYRAGKYCRGKYVALCDGDDYWIDRLKLKKQVDQLETNPEIVMSAHRAYKVDLNGNIKSAFPSIQPTVLKPWDVIFKGGGYFSTNSMMIRNELLVNIPDWFDTFPVGDYGLMNLSIQRGEIGFINEIMSAYRQGVPGSWTSRHEENWKDIFMVLVNMNRAFRHLISQENKYAYFYYIKKLHYYWLMIKLLIVRFIKRPICSILCPSQKVPPDSDR